MKKSYMKPLLTFESLSLSSTISSGCALSSTNSAEYMCPATDEETGWTVFTEYGICMVVPGPNDGICYHVPVADRNVFES